MRFYYFGCTGGPGHYMRNSIPEITLEDRRASSNFTRTNPWGDGIDGDLCPEGKQIEGHALLHQKDGWTAISFWDRSVDSRPGSNSNFLAEGNYTFEEMKVLAMTKFPKVMERFKFEIIDVTPQPAPIPPSDKTPASQPLAPPEEA